MMDFPLGNTAAAPPRRRLTWQPGMTLLIAWRNLVHDRVRLVVTLVGILFSVVLMALQSGFLIGYASTASSLVDHAGADLWIAAKGARNVDEAVDIASRFRFRALEVPDVAEAQEYIVRYSVWKRPDGGSDSVILVGFDLALRYGGPWSIAAGTIEDLEQPDAIMIDTLYKAKLGVTRLGQVVEINGRRARVVGFTHGIRTFTQAPYVFTSFKNAQTFGGLREDRTKYILVTLAPGADREQVRRELAARLPECDVLDAAAFSRSTQRYWLLSTGAGLALVLTAALGLVVGIMIVAQTLYASTIDRLPEYATLRAIGASNRYLYRIIIQQAVISGAIGYAMGIAMAAVVVALAHNSDVALLLPGELALALAGVTLVMCIGAALISIQKVTGIDPVSVFK